MAYTCAICCNPPGEIFQCGCVFCKSCIELWIISQAKISPFALMICPSLLAGHYLTDEEIQQKVCQEKYWEYIRIKLLKELSTNDEYLVCPHYHCDYMGWTDKPNCLDFECGLCGYKWKKETRLNSIISEISLVFVHFFVRNCPNCNVGIEKNLGCPHMTCSVCKYQFCWKCMQDYNGIHRCAGNAEIFPFFVILFALVLSFKIIYFSNVIHLLLFWVLQQLLYILVWIAIFSISSLPLLCINFCANYTKLANVIGCILSLLLLILILWNSVSAYDNFFQIFLTIPLTFFSGFTPMYFVYLKPVSLKKYETN